MWVDWQRKAPVVEFLLEIERTLGRSWLPAPLFFWLRGQRKDAGELYENKERGHTEIRWL
jgi:hypothetical protein